MISSLQHNSSKSRLFKNHSNNRTRSSHKYKTIALTYQRLLLLVLGIINAEYRRITETLVLDVNFKRGITVNGSQFETETAGHRIGPKIILIRIQTVFEWLES